jgi:2-dehydro-3-deoxygluconokinase
MVIVAERDAKILFNVEGENVIQRLYDRWNVKQIVLTQGAAGASAFDGKNLYHAPAFAVRQPIRIGAGDAFDAGLLCALMDGKTPLEALTYGNALAALKMTLAGDIALITRSEIEQLIYDNSSSLVR